jgi:hypothetical protein
MVPYCCLLYILVRNTIFSFKYDKLLGVENYHGLASKKKSKVHCEIG